MAKHTSVPGPSWHKADLCDWELGHCVASLNQRSHWSSHSHTHRHRGRGREGERPHDIPFFLFLFPTGEESILQHWERNEAVVFSLANFGSALCCGSFVFGGEVVLFWTKAVDKDEPKGEFKERCEKLATRHVDCWIKYGTPVSIGISMKWRNKNSVMWTWEMRRWITHPLAKFTPYLGPQVALLCWPASLLTELTHHTDDVT